MQDARDRRAGFHHAAARLDRRRPARGHRIRPALARSPCRRPGPPCPPDRETAPRPRHRGRNRDACPRRPACARTLGLSKVSVQPVAGRGQQEPPHVERAAQPLGAKCFEHEICKRTNLHRAAQKPEQMRRLGRESRRTSALPGLGIVRRQRARCAAVVAARSVETPTQTAIGKDRGEGIAPPAQSRSPCRASSAAICLEKRRFRRTATGSSPPSRGGSRAGCIRPVLTAPPAIGGLFEHADAPALGRTGAAPPPACCGPPRSGLRQRLPVMVPRRS